MKIETKNMYKYHVICGTIFISNIFREWEKNETVIVSSYSHKMD